MASKFKQYVMLGVYHVTRLTPILDALPTKGDTIYSGSAKIVKGMAEAAKKIWNLTPDLNGMVRLNNLQKFQMFPEMFDLDVEITSSIFSEFYRFFQVMTFEDTVKVYHGGYQGDSEIVIPMTSYFEGEAGLNKFLEIFWREFNNACSLSLLKREAHYTGNCRLRRIEPPKQDIYGETKQIVTDLVSEIQNFKSDGFTRTWLFLGPPGLGKTRVATELARAIKGRLLRIETANLNLSEIECIANFRPNLVLIDDIDQIDNSVLLPFLERMRELKVNMLLTSNSIDKMSDAILRPGRIDKIIEFKLPNFDDRLKVIEGFVSEFDLIFDVSDEVQYQLAEMTEGMSHAYIREIVLRLKYESFEAVRESINMMSDLLKNRKQAAEEKAAAPPKVGTRK